MKNKRLFTALAVSLLICINSLAINTPRWIWPQEDAYYYPPGVEGIFQFQPRVNKCNAVWQFYQEIMVNGAPSWVAMTSTGALGTMYCEDWYSHPDIKFTMPVCPLATNFKLDLYVSKDGNNSTTISRSFKSTIGQIGAPSPIKQFQYKCGDEPWEGMYPRGGLISVQSDPYTTTINSNYQGDVKWYNSQSQIVWTTTNGASFSPNSASTNPTTQQPGGIFYYTMPTTCQPSPLISGQMAFLRVRPTVSPSLFNGFVINPELLPCADDVKCNLAGVTYYPLPSGAQTATVSGVPGITLGPGQTIKKTKYYYVNNGTRVENGRLTLSGTTYLGQGMTIQNAKVCYEHLTENQDGIGTASTRNYVVVYTISTPYEVAPNADGTLTTLFMDCDVEVEVTVSPVTDGNDVTNDIRYTTHMATFQNLTQSLTKEVAGQTVVPTESAVCSIIFSLYATLVNGLKLINPDGGVPNPTMSVLEKCKLPEKFIPTPYISEQTIQESGLGERVSFRWLKEGNLHSLGQELIFVGNETLGLYELEVVLDDIPLFVMHQLIIKECVSGYLTFEDMIGKEGAELIRSTLPIAIQNDPILKTNTATRNHSQVTEEPSVSKTTNTTIENSVMTSLDFTIFPNPTSEFFTVSFENTENISEVNLLNTTGQKVYNFQFDYDFQYRNKLYFTENIESGSYLIQVKSKDGSIQTKRIIILK